MGRWLGREGPAPDLVLCSDAARALETWEAVAAHLDATPRVTVEPRIYMADVPTLLTCIQETPDDVGTLLVVGHNPGMQDLAVTLAAEVDENAVREADRLARKMPTASLARIAFGAESWRDVTAGAGILERFVRPKDLPQAGKLKL
jgi:phosphohistidine phosphatase